jgi:hypothetical protein
MKNEDGIILFYFLGVKNHNSKKHLSLKFDFGEIFLKNLF